LYVYDRDTNQKRLYPASIYSRTNANVTRFDWRDFNGTTIELKTQTATIASATVSTSIAKIACSCDGVAQPRAAINGTAYTGTGTIDAVLGIKWVQLCNSTQVGSSFNPIRVRQLKMFPTTLSTAQLQTLTAL
jgi:hypothetical protein